MEEIKKEQFVIHVTKEIRRVDDEDIESRYHFDIPDGVEDLHNLYGFCLSVAASIVNEKLKINNFPQPINDVKELLKEADIDADKISDVLLYLNYLVEYDKQQMNSIIDINTK